MAEKTEHLREMIRGERCLLGPGVFDGLSARIAEDAGLDFTHASGGAIARSMGYPDVGLVTMTEMLVRISEIVDATRVPTVADADTGYGDAGNAARCARAYSKAGVSARHVEDQVFPKRCGHFDGIEVIQPREMADKVKAMKDAVGDDLLIIARTDATKIEGLTAAVDRMASYLEAGADIAFVEAIDTMDALRQVSVLPAPKLLNYARSSEGLALPLDELAQMGFLLVIYPSDLQRAAIQAMDRVAAELRKTAHCGNLRGIFSTAARRDALVELIRR
jgi:2,3-dimethylmalate lyase